MSTYLKTINGANKTMRQEKTPLQRARNRMAELKKAGSLEIEHNWIKKAAKHPTSKTKAIAAMCFQCLGGTVDDSPDPGWKNEIRSCTAPNCALYPHRPYK